MKSKVMSLDEPRSPRATPSSAKNNAYGNNARRRVAYAGQGRISPWVPLGLGALAVFVVLRALSEDQKRTTTQRWLDRAHRGLDSAHRGLDSAHRSANRWWPEIRDTAEDYGHRASNYLPDYHATRDWLYDMIPSRRSISDLFARGNDWLPSSSISKPQLLANFDWNHPPRWLRNVDLSSESKRRRFLKDLRRYGSRTRDDVLSRLGLS